MICDINSLEKKISDLDIALEEDWAIYGTGNGAELVYGTLCKLGINICIKNIIDRDERIYAGRTFHKIPVVSLLNVCDTLHGIIIAAIDSHDIIRHRIIDTLTQKQLKSIRIIDIFSYNTRKDKQEFTEYLEETILKKSKEFVAFEGEKYNRKSGDTKIISWYLPQFHQMEINDRFHGKGFTEWTNTSRAIPLFTGHYQPHIPYDIGYYDLLNPDTFKRQILLAKHYGIYGFCIHYYWFSGKRIIEKPLELLLRNKDLDIPFCLDWATENWSALWDGGNKEIILEQKLKERDSENFMADILPYMKDPRYIKINERPILVIYRVDIFEQNCVRNLLNDFRRIAKKEGFPDLYIMLTTAIDFKDNVTDWGADALVEYSPHGLLNLMSNYSPPCYINPYFNGKILDASSFIKDRNYMVKHNSDKFFRSALVSWDNTARKATSKGVILQGLNPMTFNQWLKDIISESMEIHSEEENIVFVNSWNEWAEGSHLEPDMRYGYAYLQAVKEALEEVNNV